MKIKTSELIETALDWAVAKCEGLDPKYNQEAFGRTWYGWWVSNPEFTKLPRYSTNWAQGGPIIDAMMKEGLTLSQGGPYSGNTRCWAKLEGRTGFYSGPTLLIAAMRCYVASKLGEEVDVPEELI